MAEPLRPEPIVLDDHAMRVMLLNYIQMYGGQRAVARRFEVSQREISQAANGQRPVSKTVARALGFDRFVEPRRVRYRRRPR
jgi:hypothetical protein